MSGFLLIARNDIKRQFVQPFAWVVLALTCALLAWQFLVALDAYLRIVPKLANVPNSQGATDLIAIPLLRSLSGLAHADCAARHHAQPCRRTQEPQPAVAAGCGHRQSAHRARQVPWRLCAGRPGGCDRAGYAAGPALWHGHGPRAPGGGSTRAVAVCRCTDRHRIACSAWTSHPALAAAAAW
jgi:ABC-2 type transport system permease protein